MKFLSPTVVESLIPVVHWSLFLEVYLMKDWYWLPGPGLAARPGDLEAGPSLSRPQFTHPYKGGNHGPPSPRTYGGDRMGECKLNVLGTVKYYMYTKLIKKKQH